MTATAWSYRCMILVQSTSEFHYSYVLELAAVRLIHWDGNEVALA